jgi:ArsR family transcriptional regulator, arsenate/arsenite/antimonite-responsive transcriptional repressor
LPPQLPDHQVDFIKFADILAALGTEPRLRIVYYLLRAHPQGMFAGEIQNELAMQPSAVSHHLEKLKNEDLVRVKREGTFLRYTANPDVLQDLLTFLFAQCCADTKVVRAESVFQICQVQPCAPSPKTSNPKTSKKEKK